MIICFKYTSYVQSPPMVISGRNTSHPATATNNCPTRHSRQSVQCCFTSTETIRTIRDGEPRTATSTFTQLLSSVPWVQVQCCFMFTETIRTIRDAEPTTATSTFTQLLSSEHARHSSPTIIINFQGRGSSRMMYQVKYVVDQVKNDEASRGESQTGNRTDLETFLKSLITC